MHSPTARLAPRSQPNLQNIPLNTLEAKLIRAAFIAAQEFEMSEEVEQVIPLDPNLVLDPSKSYEITYLDETGHLFLSGTYGTPRAVLTAFMDFAVSFPAFELRLTEVKRTPLL